MTSYCLVLRELIHLCLVLKYLYAKMKYISSYICESRMKTTTNILNKFLSFLQIYDRCDVYRIVDSFHLQKLSTASKLLSVDLRPVLILKTFTMSHRRRAACTRFFVSFFVCFFENNLVSCNRSEQYRLV